MSQSPSDKVFAGSIPKLYDEFLVPLIFEPYAKNLAKDLALRLASRKLTRVLEVAAGTGVVTRHLAAVLPADVAIVATDLNQPMLDLAVARGTARPVEWRQADAMQLPFPDQSFDALVCQFGVMFFPDRAKAFAEARRVLKQGGLLWFNVWDRIEENDFARIVQDSLAATFPDDPPRFMARTPHGYHDIDTIRLDLRQGGFASAPVIETVAARSVANTARIPAMAYCQGTPWRNEIEARNKSLLGEATERAASAIAEQFGHGRVDGKIQAHIVAVAVAVAVE
jgi:ubiquinone/menaquinone biosynthesis C-methylase UbiE